MRQNIDGEAWIGLPHAFAVTYRRGAVLYADGYDSREDAYAAFMLAGRNPASDMVRLRVKPHGPAYEPTAL